MNILNPARYSSNSSNSLLHHSIPQTGCKIGIFNQDDNSNIGLILARDKDQVLISSLHPLKSGKHYCFSMVDVPDNSDTKRVATINVKSLWCAKQSSCVYYVCFELMEPKKQALAILNDYNLRSDVIHEFTPVMLEN